MLGLGLALLFGLFALIAAQTLDQSTDAALQERLAHARISARTVDDLISHSRHQLESASSMSILEVGTLEEQTAALHSAIHIMGSFNMLRLLDAQGQVLWEEDATLGENPTPRGDLSGREDVARVLSTGETVLAHVPHVSPLHPPVAVISVPVKDIQGSLRNVLQGDLHLSHMEGELVPLPQQSSSSRSTLVDSQGHVLASSPGGYDAADEDEEHLRLLSEFLSQGTPGVSVHSMPGGDHVVAFAPLETMGGGVIVEEQKDVALAVPQRLRGMLLIFGSSALILASLGAWLYIRRVVQPLKAMTEATTSIAQGQMDSPIVIARSDEIGELGRSFESMRRQLLVAREEGTRWEQEMEERVRLRTAQVHQLTGNIISAQEEERKRLARELHDGAAQAMATLMLSLTALEQSLPATQEMELSRQLAERASSYSLQTLHELRRMIQDLRPAALDDMGLVAGVRWYATAHLEEAGIRVQFHSPGDVPALDSAVETAIFRILQEAINNAAHHARAHNVTVTLDFTPYALRATVEDDGIGFDVGEARAHGGLGIVGMEERADLVGGRLTLHSRPGGGTRVELEVPLGR
ncbi:MAG: Histidine kinase [Dehalococcoidia bacterium]|nr:Histidine kinase [Dehalococcoidia bacterium]